MKPLRPNTVTPCVGSNAHIEHHHARTPGTLGWSNAYPSAPVPPQKPCRPMTVYGANRFGQLQQRALFFRPQQKVLNCWDRSHKKVQHPCERQQQQCNKSDASDASDKCERRDKEIQPVSISSSTLLILHQLHVDLNVAVATLTLAEAPNLPACKTPAIRLDCKEEGAPGVTSAFGLNLRTSRLNYECVPLQPIS